MLAVHSGRKAALQCESFKALYTQEEHRRVTHSFLALKIGM